MYKGSKYDKRNQKFVDEINMTYLSPDEFRDLLEGSGFDEAHVFVEYDKGWICAVARKAL
jgi:adenylate cyclase class IV